MLLNAANVLLLANREAIAQVSWNCMHFCISHFQLVCEGKKTREIDATFPECKFIKVDILLVQKIHSWPTSTFPASSLSGLTRDSDVVRVSLLLPLPFQLVTIASFLKNPADDGWEEEEEDRCLSTFSHSPHAVHSL